MRGGGRARRKDEERGRGTEMEEERGDTKSIVLI